MFNESQVNSVHNDIHLREKNDIQIQENNGMKQSEKKETEEIEPKKMNLRRKITKWPTGKGKDLIQIIIINLFALFEIILLLILKINKY